MNQAASYRKALDSCRFIDAHSHCEAYPDGNALKETLNREKILNLSAGTDPASWDANDDLARDCPWILPCVGIHPWSAGRYGPEEAEAARERYKAAPMINEIGLDTVWAGEAAPLSRQIPLLEAQLRLAREEGKPVTLHTKGAEKLVLDRLKACPPPAALVHWYDGPRETAEAFLALGCFFTIPPAFLSAPGYRRFIMSLPAERLLPETDNPSAWPWLFGPPGEPSQIQNIYEEYTRAVGKTLGMIHTIFQENLAALLMIR